MYATRARVSSSEENKKSLKVVAAAPGSSAKTSGSVQRRTRKALEDIGNVVGTRNHVKEENVPKGRKPDPPSLDRPITRISGSKIELPLPVANRPITRRFSARLAVNQATAATKSKPLQETTDAESKPREELGRGQKPSVVIREETIVQCSTASKLDSACLVSCPGRKSQQNKGGTRRREKSLTAALTARSEVSSAGLAEPQGPLLNIDTDVESKPREEFGSEQNASVVIHEETTEQCSTALKLDSARLPPCPGRKGQQNRGGTRRRKKSLTATLTARSEVACADLAEIQGPLPSIDTDDVGNPLAVVDYVQDIYSFYRETEIESCAPPGYISGQADITPKMRAVLVDWLIEVHFKFKLLPETLFLAMNVVDRYLSLQNTSRHCLQLVGVTAMLIAAKYEELWAPGIQDFIFITDNAYTRCQILEMERKILNTLRFNLTVPTPYLFVIRFLKAAASNQQINMLSFFFLELCLPEYVMLKYPPSLLAAAAVYTSLLVVRKGQSWNSVLQRHSGYSEEQLMECADLIVRFHAQGKDAQPMKIVHEKYSSALYGAVACLSPAKLTFKVKKNKTKSNNLLVDSPTAHDVFIARRLQLRKSPQPQIKGQVLSIQE